MAAIQSHDSNRKISGYLFKEEASNVREREDRQRELERLAAQEKSKKSEAERLEEERQNKLKQLMKELQDAKDEAALQKDSQKDLQKELRAVNLQVVTLNSEKENLKQSKSELQTTNSTLEEKLRTATTELATAKSTLSTKSNLESQLSTQTENNRKLTVELENAKKELKTIHWGLRDERLMIVNFKTRCAIDIGKDNWTRCAGWPMHMGNDHQYLKITACDSNSQSGPWWIRSVLHDKYIEYTSDSEPLRMKEKSGSDYQKWQITVNNNGLFQIRCVGNNKMMKLRRDHLEGSNNEIDCVDSTEDDLSKWTILRVN